MELSFSIHCVILEELAGYCSAMAEGFDLEGEFSSMQTTTQIMFGTPTDLVLQATSLFEEQLNDIQTMTPALFATER